MSMQRSPPKYTRTQTCRGRSGCLAASSSTAAIHRVPPSARATHRSCSSPPFLLDGVLTRLWNHPGRRRAAGPKGATGSLVGTFMSKIARRVHRAAAGRVSEATPPVTHRKKPRTLKGVPESSFPENARIWHPSGMHGPGISYRGCHSAYAPFNPRPPLFESFGFIAVAQRNRGTSIRFLSCGPLPSG
jgi:hypothetical protein